MGELTLPVYLKILGWAGAANMVFATVGMLLTSGQYIPGSSKLFRGVVADGY
jgi:hypothetical protein